jgi:hypothetical protein
VVCHLIGQERALVLDVELLRPGEGEQAAAKRLLERVFAQYPRFFDVVGADALYFDAPFINSCPDRHKHVIVTAKGDHLLLLQDAQGLFTHQPPGRWVDEKEATRPERRLRGQDRRGAARCRPVFPLRDWHEGGKSTPHVLAFSLPYLPTPVSPFHAEPAHLFRASCREETRLAS